MCVGLSVCVRVCVCAHLCTTVIYKFLHFCDVSYKLLLCSHRTLSLNIIDIILWGNVLQAIINF